MLSRQAIVASEAWLIIPTVSHLLLFWIVLLGHFLRKRLLDIIHSFPALHSQYVEFYIADDVVNLTVKWKNNFQSCVGVPGPFYILHVRRSLRSHDYSMTAQCQVRDLRNKFWTHESVILFYVDYKMSTNKALCPSVWWCESSTVQLYLTFRFTKLACRF